MGGVDMFGWAIVAIVVGYSIYNVYGNEKHA